MPGRKTHQVFWMCAPLCLAQLLFIPAAAQTNKTVPSATGAPSPQERLQQHYDAARTYQLGGDQQHAAAEYRTFLAGALWSVANFRARTSDFGAGADLFDQALHFAPDDADIRLAYALMRLQQRNLPEARSLAETVVRDAPSNAKARALLGRILFDQKDYTAAREHLEAAIVAAPGFDVGYLLGVTYIRMNDLARARALFDEMVAGLGDTPQIHIYFGRAYREGEYQSLDNAIHEFKTAIAKDEKAPHAHYFLALAYLQRDGESGFHEAVLELQAELRINPKDARSHYLLGYIFMRQRKPTEAEVALLRSAESDPGNPDPLVFLGQLYADAGRDKEAEENLRQAIALTKDVSRNDYQINRTHYVLARLLLRSGRREEAEKELAISKELRNRVMHPELAGNQKLPELANLSQGPEESASGTEKSRLSPEEQKQAEAYVSRLKPAIGDSYNNLGVILTARKDFTIALEYFRKAAEWSPSLETLARNWGMAAFYAAQYKQAVEPLSRELATHPDDLRIRAALGLSLFTLQNYAKALETLRPIQSEVDNDPGLQYAYAVCLVKTGDYPEGVRRLKSLEKANPNSADIHMLLGQAFADQGEHGTALEEYRKALALDPNRAQLHYLTGLALIRQGSPAEAAEELRSALKLNPADISSKYHLAFALIQLQQKEEARALMEEVIRHDPNHADAHYELGKLQLEQGEVKAAISTLETGTKLNPDGDYIHYQLAMAYRRDSRTEDAEREIKLYQELKNRRRGRDVTQSR